MSTVNLTRHLDRVTWPEESLMGSLTPSDRAALLATGSRVQFHDDDTLVMQGDVGDVLYVLTGGMVKITVSAETGAETMLAVRSRGDLIGEFAVLDAAPRAATVRAVGTVGAIRIPGARFGAFTEAHPSVVRPSPAPWFPSCGPRPCGMPPSATGAPGSGSRR